MANVNVKARTTVYLGAGKSQPPGSTFPLEEKEARELKRRGALEILGGEKPAEPAPAK